MNFYDNAPTITGNDNINYKGIASLPNFEQYKSSYKSHTITKTEEYRPDIIALNLLGNDDLAWTIDAINGFIFGIEEYESGIEINYLETAILKTLGIV